MSLRTKSKESRVMKDRSDWMPMSEDIPRNQQDDGTTRSGPLRIQTYSPTSMIRELATRPRGNRTRCISLDWAQMKGYLNPPWNLKSKVLAQIQSQQTTLVIVTPLWKSQLWYTMVLSMATKMPLLLPRKTDLKEATHRVNQPDRIPRLVAWTISGRDTKTNVFQEKLCNSYWPHGDRSPPNHMIYCSPIGQAGVTNGVPLPFWEI